MNTTKGTLVISLALTLAACGSVNLQNNTTQAWNELRDTGAIAASAMNQSVFLDRQLLLKDASIKDTTDQVVVSYLQQNEKQFKATLSQIGAQLLGTLAPKQSDIRMALVQVPAELSATKVVQALNGVGSVRYAELSQTYQQGTVPGSANVMSQAVQAQAATDPLAVKQWWITRVKADKVRNIATGKGIVVGVVDDDFNRLHEDLQAEGKIVTGIDTVETKDFENPVLLKPDQPLKSGSHGSGSAGTIAERMGNSVGGVGMAPDAILMPIRIFGPLGSAGSFNIAAGVVWAVDNGANILNNSWGGGGYSRLIKDAMDYALDNGVVVVGSAGNDYSDLHSGPAAYPGVIAVGASTNTDTKTDFSNLGPRVDLFAPGTDGLTTYSTTNTGYGLFGGTSMAGPVVAGGAALLLEKAKALGVTLTPYQMKKLLVSSTDPMADQPEGRLNVEKALAFTKDTVPADGGYVKVNVNSLLEETPLAGVDVTLIPLQGQNKNLPYVSQTSQAFLTDGGQALFYGIEPGRYQVNVAGPGVYVHGGSQTTLTGNIEVKSGKNNLLSLNYAIAVDAYEYTKSRTQRNNAIATATDLQGVSADAFAQGVILSGTFDNANYIFTAPSKGPDVDFFAVKMAVGETIKVDGYAFKLGSKARVAVELYDANGAKLSTGVAGKGAVDTTFNYTASAAGTYYVKTSNTLQNEGANSYYGLIFTKSQPLP